MRVGTLRPEVAPDACRKSHEDAEAATVPLGAEPVAAGAGAVLLGLSGVRVGGDGDVMAV